MSGGGKKIQQYFCLWQISDREIRLCELETSYHQSCEAFDRIICTGPYRGGVVFPATHEEMQLISKNEMKVRKEILAAADAEGFSRNEILEAIRCWKER